jgi:hypothetical protein
VCCWLLVHLSLLVRGQGKRDAHTGGMGSLQTCHTCVHISRRLLAAQNKFLASMCHWHPQATAEGLEAWPKCSESQQTENEPDRHKGTVVGLGFLLHAQRKPTPVCTQHAVLLSPSVQLRSVLH